MNQKVELTKYLMQSLGVEITEKSIRKTIPIWWKNPRKKVKGGLKLTDLGFKILKESNIVSYEVKFDEPFEFNNDLIVWVDNNIDCPFYIAKKSIFLFGERSTVQLVLFSGNLHKWRNSHKRHLENHAS
jgi:hypothetical protein